MKKKGKKTNCTIHMNTKKIPIFFSFFKEEITKKLSLMTKKKREKKQTVLFT